MVNKVIFDTDPGVDDAFALLYALSHPEIEVLGITTVFGNVPIDIATKNALILSEKSGLNTPVYTGASKPLERSVTVYPTFIHGKDGFGNINHCKSKLTKSNIDAENFIIQSVQNYPGQVNIIAIGPLTNIGNSLKKKPSIAKTIKSITLMGGSWMAGGNITPVAEANIYNDPEAADTVFNSGVPITMVGLDVTHKVFLSDNNILKLSLMDNHSGKFLKKISNFYINFYRETKNMDGCFFHDATAVIAFTNPELFEFKNGKVFVSKDDLTRGQTVVFDRHRKHETLPADDRKNINIANDVNSEKIICEFLKIAKNHMS
ncbi:MAG: nucleoside hydrolase [Candidatus Puniceispirillales bacterium]